MKILHLLYESEGDSFGIGGVGIRAYEIYGRLKERHDITLLCKRYPGARDHEKNGLRHLFAGLESRSLTVTLLAYAWHAARFVRERGEDYDVIVEEFSPAIPTSLHTYERRPLVLQMQGFTGIKYFAKYNPLSAGVLYLSERYRPALYRNILVVSEASRARYRIGALPGRRMEVISNGISGELLSTVPGSADYILFMGRIDLHHKGLDILLDAYGSFRESHPEIRLIIAGDGRDRERFMGLMQRLPVAVRDGIRLAGWVEGAEKVTLLSNALMVVVPSRYETQGIITLEAMACGKPLVVSDIPELRHVVDCGAGIDFRAEDAASLASSMSALFGREDLAAMGQKGRQWVGGLTWERIAERYEAFLSSVAGG